MNEEQVLVLRKSSLFQLHYTSRVAFQIQASLLISKPGGNTKTLLRSEVQDKWLEDALSKRGIFFC